MILKILYVFDLKISAVLGGSLLMITSKLNGYFNTFFAQT